MAAAWPYRSNRSSRTGVILARGKLHDQLVCMNLKRTTSIFASFIACTWPIAVHAQSAESVKWVSEKENATLWAAIRTDFHGQLQPDDPAKVAPVMAYSYKYIYRVAQYQDSALVLVHHLETKYTKYPGYYSAFNYDAKSHTHTPIKGVEVVSVFKFIRFASLDPAAPPDIVFTWMTCTECEASQVLSTLHYDGDKHGWTLRSWETDKDIWWTSESGPVIWADVSASDTISFDCLHGFLTDTGSLAFGIRCHEVTESETGKREIKDVTLKYSFMGPDSRLEIASGENKTKLLSELCEESPRNKLCKSAPARMPRQ